MSHRPSNAAEKSADWSPELTTPVTTKSPAANVSGRLEFLDALRGIAAIAVVLAHSPGYGPDFFNFTHRVFDIGKFGVMTFFLISGYIIPFSLENGGSLKRFWKGRFFRLYPLYWFSLGLVCFLEWLHIPMAPPEFRASLTYHSFMNLTMIQGFWGVPPAIGVYETLAIEFVFYSVCSVLFLLGQLKNTLRLAWAFVAFLFVVSVPIPYLLSHRIPMAGVSYLGSSFIGTAIYRSSQGLISKRQLEGLLAVLCVVLAAGIFVNYVQFYRPDPLGQLSFISVFSAWISAFVLFLIVVNRKGKRVPRFLVWLGTVSYSLYLMHTFALRFTPHTNIALLDTCLGILSSLALASVTYHFIEAPLIALGKKK